MESLVAFNLNMEREVQTKDFVLVAAVAAAAAVTVVAKFGAETLVDKLKTRKALKQIALAHAEVEAEDNQKTTPKKKTN